MKELLIQLLQDPVVLIRKFMSLILINQEEKRFLICIWTKLLDQMTLNQKNLAQMTPGFTGAEIENLVNTAITEAVHRGK